jgi:SAM-dependent methyltransferase/quercetin dioxygenase-like cupin family protein
MPATATLQTAAPRQSDLAAVKGRQQSAWSSGDYAVVGTTLQIVGEELCEALDLRPGSKVLDVAAGNGNATLAAARRWCEVTSTDYVPALLERGRERATAERLAIDFRQADAEALPFPDASFDVVVSTFGVMFTADQDKAAAELLRVCKPGGKIGLANWTPEGFIGQLFKTLGKHLPPPAGVKSPALWGTRARLNEMFGAQASNINAEPRMFVFRYRSARCEGAGGADPRPSRAGRRIQSRGRWRDGGAQRIPRSGHHQALTLFAADSNARNIMESVMKHAIKHIAPVALVLGLCALAAPLALGQHGGAHTMVLPSDLKWTDVPSLPPGAKIAMIEGPMNQAVPFTIRLKFPKDYQIPAHSHPAIERVTVLSGTFHMGTGDKLDKAKSHALPTGAIAIMQPGTNHFAWTSDEVVVQLNGTGPWGIDYVNPADDPRKK